MGVVNSDSVLSWEVVLIVSDLEGVCGRESQKVGIEEAVRTNISSALNWSLMLGITWN